MSAGRFDQAMADTRAIDTTPTSASHPLRTFELADAQLRTGMIAVEAGRRLCPHRATRRRQAPLQALSRHGAQEVEPAGENLRRLPAAVRVAQEVGAGLGAGPVLLRSLPCRRYAPAAMSKPPGPPHTPDGRYFVVVGTKGPRLWRATRPDLAAEDRASLTSELMSARRAVRSAMDAEALGRARARVDAAKVALGERGPVWWSDGAPDLNRRLVKGTGYADWWSTRLQQGTE